MTTEVERSSYERKRLAAVLVVGLLVVYLLHVREQGASSVAVASFASPANGVVAVAPAALGTDGPNEVTIAVTGEILPHPSVVDHAARYGVATGSVHDFAPLFGDLAPALTAADLAICHLEVPVAPPGSELSGYPAFGIPAEIGVGIAVAGWDRCSTASNHTNDRGTAGIRATLDALDVAAVGHSGTARTLDEANTIPLVDVGGVTVGHLSYTWGFNGTPPAEAWMADVLDPERVLADAAAARAAGARIVVVSVHWGDEYDTRGSAEQRALAERLLASPDIDLLVGHGPHVVQPVEAYDGKYALLSVGNLVANQGASKPLTYDGVVVTVTFARQADGRFVAAPPEAQATWYDRDAGRVRLVGPALAAGGADWLMASLSDSRSRTAQIIGPLAATR